MKRIFSLTLSVVLLFSLGACAVKNPSAGTDPSKTDAASSVSSGSQSGNGSFSGSGVQTTDHTDGTASSGQSLSGSVSDLSSEDVPFGPSDSGDGGDAPEDTPPAEDVPETPSTPSTPSSPSQTPESTPFVPPTPISGKLMAITDQKNDQIIVVNLDASDITAKSAIVWTWSTKTKGDVPHANLCNSRLDDVKLRNCSAWGGMVVGLTSSSGMVALVAYPSGTCLFSANMKGYGPHSIEILPNGLIAVAGSGNGNNDKAVIRIYRASSKTDTHYVELPLESAHGVCYDPQTDLLWGLGGSALIAYKVGGTRNNPTLSVAKDTGIRFSGGHDLSPVYGNPDRFWVTYSGKVAQYVKSQNTFVFDYPGAAAINQKSVKSVNTYADGVTVMTIADPNNATASHNTDKVRMFRYVQNNTGAWLYKYVDISFEGARDFYKVRAFVPDYQ